LRTLVERVEVEPGYRLEDYAEYNYLAPQVADLEAAARKAVPGLDGRTIWIVSSTRQGGGVAESLPRIVALMRQLGLSVAWVVIHTPDPGFFALTKRIHNQLHGVGERGLGRSDRELYDAVSDRLADALANDVSSGDVLVVHDPQPLGTGARVKKRRGIPAIWRCHVGFDGTTPASKEAWEFLRADSVVYDRSIFTLPAYVPPFLSGSATVMAPGIDPLTHKNREFSVHKTSGILIDAALAATMHPALGGATLGRGQERQSE
jgi:trehalose synthase